jgi:hypothetical protein
MAISRERVDLEESQLQADVLLPFVAFESEMHNFPLGESREYWNKQALAARDARLQEIVDAARLEILDACRDLLDEWS